MVREILVELRDRDSHLRVVDGFHVSLARAVERSDGESVTPTSVGHRQPSGDEVVHLPRRNVPPVSYIQE